jgi:TRAP-type C4-dicarboxylate transport system substrate-binding protein
MTRTARDTTLRNIAGAAVALLILTACEGAGGADKAGSEAVVLRLASIDKVNDSGQAYGPEAFVHALSDVSGGELQVDVLTDYGAGDAAAESKLVEAIAAGDLDGGWPTTRAFARAGIGGLEAVEAPMTITSYAAERALVTAPVAEDLLGSLHGSGVLGLGLAVGPLRRPFAADAPLLDLSDWAGILFRSFNSPVQSQSINALGAEPVDVGFGWIDQIRAGELRGAEMDIAQYLANGNGPEAGYVTGNLVLWPKVFVLSISQGRFDALTDRQQDWVREAADIAVQASVDADYDEDTAAATLCERGVTFYEASATQLDELRAALRPTNERLAADPKSRPFLAQIQAIAAEHARTDVPEPAGVCVADEATLGTTPQTSAAVPDGVYRVEVTTEDLADAGIPDNGGGWTGTWTLTIRDATFQLTCRPLDQPGKDCANTVSDVPFEAGHLRGVAQTVYFVADAELLSRVSGCLLPASRTAPSHCYSAPTYRMTWESSGTTLRFSDYVADNWPNRQYLVEPWQKIG